MPTDTDVKVKNIAENRLENKLYFEIYQSKVMKN
jgi:hypothetical protein